MFDTHKTSVDFPNEIKIDIKQQRAPTDESIKLAKEYEEKILKSILDKALVDANLFKFTMIFQYDDMMRYCVHVKLNINGKDFSKGFFIKYLYEDTFTEIRFWISEIFSSVLISAVYQDMPPMQGLGYSTHIVTNE